MRILASLAIGLLITPVLALAEQTDRTDAQRTFRQLDLDRDGQLAAEEIASEHAALFARLVRTSDADDDGRLSADEFAGGLEVRRPNKPIAEKQPSRLPGADELLLLVAMMDRNADGMIEPEEPPARLRQFYQRIEERIGGNDQGQINVRQMGQAAPRLTQLALATVRRLDLDVELELALLPEKNWALVQRLDRPRQPIDVLADPAESLNLFRRLDANGDGQIVYDEVPEPFAARFDRLLARVDRNRDERISQQEMKGLSERLRFFAGRARSPRPDRNMESDSMDQQTSPRGDE